MNISSKSLNDLLRFSTIVNYYNKVEINLELSLVINIANNVRATQTMIDQCCGKKNIAI